MKYRNLGNTEPMKSDWLRPPGASMSLFPDYSRYSNTAAVTATEQYVTLAQDHNLDPAQMALAYVNGRPFLTSTIIGATTMDQLRSNIDSIHLQLSSDVLTAIDEIHNTHANPSP